METIVQLSSASWVGISPMPESIKAEYDTKWDELWDMRLAGSPSKVVTGGVTRESPRVHASYGVVPPYKGHEPSYMFSGKDGCCAKGTTSDVPSIVRPLVDYFNDKYGTTYNQVTINWYENGNNFTAQHADYMEGMNPDVPIIIVTLCPDADVGKKLLRQFWIRSKDSPSVASDGTTDGASDGRFAREDVSVQKSTPIENMFVESLIIPTYHGRVIRMGGRMQQEYRHGIPKHTADPDACAHRMSITLRAYTIAKE